MKRYLWKEKKEKIFVEPKFLCTVHSEDRVWSRERFIARAKQGEWVAHAQKTRTPDDFQTRVFKDRVRGEDLRIHDEVLDLLIGWW